MRVLKASTHPHAGLSGRLRQSRGGSSNRLRQLLLVALITFGWGALLLGWRPPSNDSPRDSATVPAATSSPLVLRDADKSAESPGPTDKVAVQRGSTSRRDDERGGAAGEEKAVRRKGHTLLMMLAVPLESEMDSDDAAGEVVGRIPAALRAILEMPFLEIRLVLPGCPADTTRVEKAQGIANDTMATTEWFGYCRLSAHGGTTYTDAEGLVFSDDGHQRRADAVVVIPRWWLSSDAVWDRHLNSTAQLIRSTLLSAGATNQDDRGSSATTSAVHTIALVRKTTSPFRRADDAERRLFAPFARGTSVIAADGVSLLQSTLDGGTVLHPRGWGRRVGLYPKIAANVEDVHVLELRGRRVVEMPLGVGWGATEAKWREALEWLRTSEDGRRLVASTVERNRALRHFSVVQLIAAIVHSNSCAAEQRSTEPTTRVCRWTVASTTELDWEPPYQETPTTVDGDAALLRVMDDLAGMAVEWRGAPATSGSNSEREKQPSVAASAASLRSVFEWIALGVAASLARPPRQGDSTFSLRDLPDSAAAEVVSTKARLYWDPFCSCTGINIEAINFLVPLDQLMSVRAVANADCWCNGFPALDPMTLTRIRRPWSPNRRELRGGESAEAISKEEAISLWVTHKPIDFLPSFPYTGAIRFDHRPSKLIARVMIEHDRFSPSAVARLARRTAAEAVDEIWVPSPFLVEVLRCSGFSVPNEATKVVVVPEAIDVSMYDPRHFVRRSSFSSTTYRFLSNFKWEPRKGWDLLLEAYLTEFRHDEPVELVLKTYLYLDSTPRSVRRIQQRIMDFVNFLVEAQHHARVNSWADFESRFPKVVIVPSEIPASDMPSFYAAHDAFVLPSRGEGWGLPYQEAMAMGLPCIATRWSGMLAFMNDENAFLINVSGMEPSTDSAAEYEGRIRARVRGDASNRRVHRAESDKVLNGQDATSTFAFYRDSVFGVPVDKELSRTLTHGDERRSCEPRREPYWAVPDLTHLRTLLRHVFSEPEGAAMRGRKARRDMELYFSREAVSGIVAKRVLNVVREMSLALA